MTQRMQPVVQPQTQRFLFRGIEAHLPPTTELSDRCFDRWHELYGYAKADVLCQIWTAVHTINGISVTVNYMAFTLTPRSQETAHARTR